MSVLINGQPVPEGNTNGPDQGDANVKLPGGSFHIAVINGKAAMVPHVGVADIDGGVVDAFAEVVADRVIAKLKAMHDESLQADIAAAES